MMQKLLANTVRYEVFPHPYSDPDWKSDVAGPKTNFYSIHDTKDDHEKPNRALEQGNQSHSLQRTRHDDFSSAKILSPMQEDACSIVD